MKMEFGSKIVLWAAVLTLLAAPPTLAQRQMVDVDAPGVGGGIGPPVSVEFAGTYLFEVDGRVVRQWQPVSGLMTLNGDGCATASSIMGLGDRAPGVLQTHGIWKPVHDEQVTGRFLTLIHDRHGNLARIERMTVHLDFEPLGDASGTVVIEKFLPEQLDNVLGPNTHDVPLAGTSRGDIVLRRLELD